MPSPISSASGYSFAGGADTIADAGAQQSQTTYALVTLDGSGSTAGTYAWTLEDPLGVDRTALLSSSTAEKPTFTPDLTGTWLATITVDGGGNSDTTSVIIGDPAFGLVFNPITAAKNDPNTIETSAPVAAGSAGFYTYAFDATTLYTAPADMLLYYATIPGVGFDDIFLITLFLEMQSESDTRLCFSACVVDAPTALATANGVYGGISAETSGNYDHFVRRINIAMPNTGASAGNPPMYVMRYMHNPSRTSVDGVLYDQSASPWTYRAHDTDQNDTSPAATGDVTIGVLVTTRTIKTATETFQARLRYTLDVLDAA